MKRMSKKKLQNCWQKNNIIKVGVDTNGYNAVKFDDDGWADANRYLPKDYDLLKMMCEDGKCYSGWHNGIRFEGYRLPDDGVVKHWKKHDLNYHY